ncbi:MAG TPA: diguanylate cyclase [Actinomycetota bacterium]|nr:diguanylate cyclase [Actinomycetota bacterium]
MSCGVATFPEHASSAEELVRDADVALYVAKAAGRNRVVAFDPASAAGTVLPLNRLPSP